MISLYNNNPNRRLKFKMNISGVESSSIIPRLVIESSDKSKAILVNGTIEENVCYFAIPELSGFDKGEKVKAYYEAIVDEEQYSKLWEDTVDVESKREIKVSEAVQEEETKKKTELQAEAMIEEEDDEEFFEPLRLINKK
jgi:folate-dependent tRNA-U54 methylase TrmFO/GidA